MAIIQSGKMAMACAVLVGLLPVLIAGSAAMAAECKVPGECKLKEAMGAETAQEEEDGRTLALLQHRGVATATEKIASGPEFTAPSVSSCHQGSQVTQTPDPVQSEKPVTISYSGTLAEDVSAGVIKIDGSLKMFGIGVSEQETIPFTVSPALPAGPVSLTIGPTTPPGVADLIAITGTVKVESDNSKEIECISIKDKTTSWLGGWLEMEHSASPGPSDNVTLQRLLSEGWERVGEPAAPRPGTLVETGAREVHGVAARAKDAGCGDSEQYVQTAEADGVTTITTDFPETISEFVITATATLSVNVLIPLKYSVDIKVPITISPPVPAHTVITLGPFEDVEAESSASVLANLVKVSAEIKAEDSAGNTLFCSEL